MLGPLREDSPRHVGRYTVLARLGAGGMGEVFLGQRDGSGDDVVPVAVKTVRRDVAQDPGFRQRFRREIEVARSVTGPALAPVLDGDADAEVPWLAIGYVAGPTLSAAVRRSGALAEEEVRMLGAELARALETVHAAGVVHRDVKPGNVLLAADGPRLIDFGIARGAGATPLTTTSRMIGSPAFMSPEHVAGSGRVVPASDVFCLASVLCFAATGRDPFGDGPVAAVLYRVKYVEADLDGVPDALRAVLQDCLVADPSARPTPAVLAARLAPEGSVGWPGPVAAHIAEYERELASVRALGGPLPPGYTPTQGATASRTPEDRPPAQGAGPAPDRLSAESPGPTPVDQLPTQGPGLPPGPVADRPARRRRLLGAALVAVVLAGAAAGGLLAARDADGGGSSAAPSGPAGWKAWHATFSGTPLGCAAGQDVVVCRTADGSYEALSAADGKNLWTYEAVEEQGDGDARISPSGQFFMPGGSTLPVVRGDSVYFATGNRLLAVDALTGTSRWEARTGGAHMPESSPQVADGLVFADIGDLPDGSEIAAFDVRDGTEKWRKPLVGEGLAKAQRGNFWPLGARDGILYARNEEGLRAFRTEDGAERDAGCPQKTPSDFAVHCPQAQDGTGQESPPAGVGRDASVVARTDRVTVFRTGTSATPGAEGAGEGTEEPEIVLVGRDDGEVLGRYGLGEDAEARRRNPASAPAVVDGTLVWADTDALHSIALGDGDTPGPLRRTAIEDVPVPEIEEPYDPAYGDALGKQNRPPEIFPAGRVVHIVYRHGIAVSVAIPGPASS
ncbi:protein kinase [Streptomyces sp. HB132]|uniref:serine/threonine-protein kinase n=1 Tax=Streptomyces sp. HB132 TaxID=767388 RepID=UPI00196202AC|nr:serine/threonine-protein kinase [Streptomyces sp. HB132]MBM7441380.1 outer membrane protein assembly factor BamB [Streptomyces sp. HB132]